MINLVLLGLLLGAATSTVGGCKPKKTSSSVKDIKAADAGQPASAFSVYETSWLVELVDINSRQTLQIKLEFDLTTRRGKLILEQLNTTTPTTSPAYVLDIIEGTDPSYLVLASAQASNNQNLSKIRIQIRDSKVASMSLDEISKINFISVAEVKAKEASGAEPAAMNHQTDSLCFGSNCNSEADSMADLSVRQMPAPMASDSGVQLIGSSQPIPSQLPNRLPSAPAMNSTLQINTEQ